MAAPRVWVSLTEGGDIKAEVAHPVYHATLWVICDIRTGNVTRTNFDKSNHEDRFRDLVRAAREHVSK